MLSDLPTKIATKLSGLNKHEAKVIGVKCGIPQSFATPKTRRIKVGLATVIFVAISYLTRCTRETWYHFVIMRMAGRSPACASKCVLYYRKCPRSKIQVGLPYVRFFPDMSSFLGLKILSGGIFFNLAICPVFYKWSFAVIPYKFNAFVTFLMFRFFYVWQQQILAPSSQRLLFKKSC